MWAALRPSPATSSSSGLSRGEPLTEHRVLEQDTFRIVSTADFVTEMRARVVVKYDNGLRRRFVGQLVGTADRLTATRDFGFIEFDGVVERAVVSGVTNVKRGRNFVELATLDQEEQTQDILCQDYLHNNNQVVLNQFKDPGPGGGNGFITKNVLADDVTPVDVEHTLGITNALRRIDGFIWYYHRDGTVDDVTLRVSARDFGEGLPTGMTSGGNTLIQVFPTAGVLTLSANQEGLIYVSAQDGSRISISLDNGAKVTEDTSVAAPLPFPYWANENDVGEILFDVGNAQAADRHSIYIIEERWIDA